MLKQLLRDSLLYSIAGLLSRAAALLFIPFYTHLLAPTDYGVMDYLSLLINLLVIVVPLDIGQGLSRYMPEASEDEQPLIASTSFWFTCICYGLFLLAGLSLSPWLSLWLIGSPDWSPQLSLALVTASGYGLYILLSNQLRWLLRPGQYAFVSLLYSLGSQLFAAGLVIGLKFGINGIFWGQLGGAVSAGLLAAWFSRRLLRFEISWIWLRRMMAFSLPLLPSSLGVYLTLYVDRILVKELIGFDQLGIYGIGLRFASLAGLCISGFQNALTPLIYRHYQEAETPANIALVLNRFFALTGWCILGLAWFSRELLQLLISPDYYAAWPLIPLLATSVVLSSLYLFFPGLSLAKKTATLTLINLSNGLLNIVFNLLLISFFGLLGSALGSVLSAAAYGGLNYYFSQRHYPIPVDWRYVIGWLAGLLLLGAPGALAGDGSWQFLLIKIPCWLLLGFGLYRLSFKPPSSSPLLL